MNLQTGRRVQGLPPALHGVGVVAQPTPKNGTAATAGSFLASCAEKDRGGGVSLVSDGLASRTFAIYTTAVLPRFWHDILHDRHQSGVCGNGYVAKLDSLAQRVFESLPIYTSFDNLADIAAEDDAKSSYSGLFETLPTSPIPKTTQLSTHSLIPNKPNFLLNAARHRRHCIIGQGSITETLLVVLRRPWCVLEICVATMRDYRDSDQTTTDVLKDLLRFAKLAYEKDASGYAMAVFLLEHESSTRHAAKTLLLPAVAESLPCKWSHGSYQACNRAVFLPSLMSFNAFWLCLICVSAVEAQMSFSTLVGMLAVGTSGRSFELSNSKAPHFTLCSQREKRTRRRSDSEVYLSRILDVDSRYESIATLVEDLLRVYRGVVRKTGDYI